MKGSKDSSLVGVENMTSKKREIRYWLAEARRGWREELGSKGIVQ